MCNQKKKKENETDNDKLKLLYTLNDKNKTSLDSTCIKISLFCCITRIVNAQVCCTREYCILFIHSLFIFLTDLILLIRFKKYLCSL